jgi:SRSO17 transposase
VANGHIGVWLGAASPLGHGRLDGALSLPKDWTDARERCRQAGIPADRPCATKPPPARQLRARAVAASVPAAWVTGDRVSGPDRPLRLWLEGRSPPDVLAVSGPASVWGGSPPRPGKTLLASLPVAGWTRLRAGAGAKGPRWSDGRGLPLAAPREPGWCRWWLVRRRLHEPTELTAAIVLAPQAPPLEEVVPVAGSRGTSESGGAAATGEAGLEHAEVRTWTGWYRQITLALWALARLTSRRAGPIAVEAFKKRRRPRREARPRAAFKAGRGLASR